MPITSNPALVNLLFQNLQKNDLKMLEILCKREEINLKQKNRLVYEIRSLIIRKSWFIKRFKFI